MASNIILTGFSYTGKSAVARTMARTMGWRFVDTDQLIVQSTGRPIPEIFSGDGEARFRSLEKAALAEACGQRNVVIATGGGVVMDPDNVRTMGESGVVICLEAQPVTIHQRLRQAERRSPSKRARPLLAGDDPLSNIKRIKAERQPFYAVADWTVHTDTLSVDEVVEEALRGYGIVKRKRAANADAGRAFPDAAYVVTTETQSYPGYVGWGIMNDLGGRMREAGLSDIAYVVADKAVHAIHGERIETSLTRAGFTAEHYLVEPGEASKSMATAEAIYGWLAGLRAERGHCIVSLGGGMVGDLAGFVAATYLRGMPLVHVPTSLLAMVDASVGGKVAVDLPEGKNLVGAFHQPRLVLADTQALSTLPPRDLTSGWAELIKHGLILDPKLFAFMDEHRDRLLGLDPELITEAVKRSVAIKARIVTEDEKETKGRRSLLNYGHTVGHALEAVMGYQGLLHGEAVAIGMSAAADISHRMRLLGAEALKEQRRLLEAFGLPVTAPSVDRDEVRLAMKNDKKVSGKAIRWVLLQDIGRSAIRGDVPEDVVRQALDDVIQG